MPFSVSLIKRLEAVEPPLREVLIALLEEVERQREDSITRKEFLEFAKKTEENFQRVWEAIERLTKAQEESEKRIGRLEAAVQELVEAQKASEKRISKLEVAVEKLTEAQKRTEIRLNELAEAQKKTEIRLNELAEAQKKTEIRLNELAEAQKRTEIRVNELAEAQKKTEEEIRKLGIGLKLSREQLGGLAKSVAYALENEAFRKLPAFLEEKHKIKVIDKIIRAEIDGEEINIFGKVKKDGKDMILVGEAVLKLDDRKKLKLLSEKVQLVKENYGIEVVPIIITHFAKKDILERAEKAGVIIVQSFEWD